MINHKNTFLKRITPAAAALSVCLSMGVVSNSANATIKLYEKGPLTYSIKADWQIQFKQDVGDDQELDLEYDDLEFKNIINYDLGNGMSAFGEVHFSWDQAGDREDRDRSRFEEGFLGLDFGSAKIAIGRTNTAGDEFGVEKAYEKVGIAEDGFEDVADIGDDLVRLDAKLGSVTVVSSYEIEGEGEGATGSKGDDESWFDIFAAVKFGGAKVAIAYMDYDSGPSGPATTREEDEIVGISFSYKFSSFDIGADFSTIDRDINGASSEKDIYNVVAGFKVGPNGSVGLGVNNEDDSLEAEDVSGWYANYTYKFPAAKNVRLIAEVGDNDKDNVDVGYLLGMRILL